MSSTDSPTVDFNAEDKKQEKRQVTTITITITHLLLRGAHSAHREIAKLRNYEATKLRFLPVVGDGTSGRKIKRAI